MINFPELINSFKYAIAGIKSAVKNEQNLRIHFLAAAIVLIVAFLLKIPKVEFIVLILLIALVIVAELFNSVVEYIVDLITSEFHPLAKLAKDVAAGAVLFMAIVSVVIGILIFYQPLVNLLK